MVVVVVPGVDARVHSSSDAAPHCYSAAEMLCLAELVAREVCVVMVLVGRRSDSICSGQQNLQVQKKIAQEMFVSCQILFLVVSRICGCSRKWQRGSQ